MAPNHEYKIKSFEGLAAACLEGKLVNRKTGETLQCFTTHDGAPFSQIFWENAQGLADQTAGNTGVRASVRRFIGQRDRIETWLSERQYLLPRIQKNDRPMPACDGRDTNFTRHGKAACER